MLALITVLVVFGTALVGLAIICWTIVKLVGAGTTRSASVEEARMLQEIHRGLTRMEERVEALETLLFDKDAGGRQ
ncbi:MAG TPA: hypothetical protein ENN29_04560 [Candidatus Hydrogenedentes bacterium]|nr:hypothetical protein [Candidatus Hydrogenedentota bacterium]